MPKMKQPMKFDMDEGWIDVDEWLDRGGEIDDVNRNVTSIEMRSSENAIYVHWEEGSP